MIQPRNMVLPLARVKPHPQNYNRHPASQIDQLGQSYEEFGQYRSAVVWERPNGEYILVAGHGFIEAAQKRGATEARFDVLPLDTPENTIKRIMLADNLHAHNSVSDDELLAELLREQVDLDLELAAIGMTEAGLDLLLAELHGEGEGDETDRFEEEEEGDEEEEHEESGNLLALLNVTIDEPRHQVAAGDVWRLGPHTLVCAQVFDEWQKWTGYLKPGDLLLPFAGPLAVLSEKAAIYSLVIVQPDAYLAGHILDRYSEIHGERSVSKVEGK